MRFRESLQVNDHYRLFMVNKENENVVEQCAELDRGYIFDEESGVSSIEADGMCESMRCVDG